MIGEKLRANPATVNTLLHKLGLYHPDTIFVRNETKRDNRGCYPFWEYLCPVCSQDQFTKAGLCSGVFTGSLTHLKKGRVSCRCSKSVRWKKEHIEFQISQLLIKESHCIDFSWVTPYNNKKSKFHWSCIQGHSCTTSVTKFLNGKQRCDSCAREDGKWGYYTYRQEEEDNLYLLQLCSKDVNNSVTESFIKLGRTFDIKDRLARLRRCYAVELIASNKGLHKDVFLLEQEYLKSLRDNKYTPLVSFGGMSECFIQETLSCIDISKDKTFKLNLEIKERQ